VTGPGEQGREGGLNIQTAASLATWPTPDAAAGNLTDSTWEKRRAEMKEKHGNGNDFGMTLGQASSLAGWPSPRASEGEKDARSQEGAATEVARNKGPSLSATVQALATWATPAARDFKSDSASKEYHEKRWAHPRGQPLSAQAAQLSASGETPSGSPVETEKPGQLNPGLSRWLMGLPKEWCDCAVTAMESWRRSQKRSSKATKTSATGSQGKKTSADPPQGRHRATEKEKTRMETSTKVITPEAVLSYPHLFEPQEGQNPGDDPKYGCALVFLEGSDLTEMKKAAVAALVDKFGEDKAKDLLQRKAVKMPFRDDAEAKGYPEGSIFVNCRSKQQPGIVSIYPDTKDPKKPAAITDPEKVYPGVIVMASLRAFYYDVSGNKGVSFALNNIQVRRDGERLDGRVKAEDEFSADPDAVPSLGDLTTEEAPKDEISAPEESKLDLGDLL
jgi:hypothetical protein